MSAAVAKRVRSLVEALPDDRCLYLLRWQVWEVSCTDWEFSSKFVSTQVTFIRPVIGAAPNKQEWSFGTAIGEGQYQLNGREFGCANLPDTLVLDESCLIEAARLPADPDSDSAEVAAFRRHLSRRRHGRDDR